MLGLAGALAPSLLSRGAMDNRGRRPTALRLMESVMPLTPLPASNTKRYFLVVTGPSFTHRVMCRVDSTIDNASAVANLAADCSVIAPIMGDNYSFTGLEVAEVGSDIRNIVPGWSVIAGSSGQNPGGQDLTRTFAVRGRSTSGRKFRNLWWGLVLPHNDDFEYTPAPETPADAFLSQLQGHVHMWLTIDGLKPVIYRNLTEDYNDHFEHQVRP